MADHSQQHPRQGLKEGGGGGPRGSALPPGFRAPVAEGTALWGLASQLSSLLGAVAWGQSVRTPCSRAAPAPSHHPSF